MNKINGSERMKVSAENPATTHTRNRCSKNYFFNRKKQTLFFTSIRILV